MRYCSTMKAIGAALLIGAMGAFSANVSAADAPAAQTSIMVKGSDTMVNLCAAWAEKAMKEDPSLKISVTGGGSGTGISALINGTTDICASSREMKKEEKSQLTKYVETVMARDGIAIAVNPANPLTEITMQQLRDIYTGKVTNWSALGGPDQKITVLSRETSSGTYGFFQEHVLKNDDYSNSILMMPATSAIIEAVASDKWDIGYVGLGYAVKAKTRVKVLNVKADANTPAVEPSEETVRSGKYSISRPLFFYTNGVPAGGIEKFISFCLGETGQSLVAEQGYVPLK